MPFEIFRKEDDPRFYFRLVDERGKVLLNSQAYKSKYGCRKGIASVRRNGGNEGQYVKKILKEKYLTIYIKAPNNEIIGQIDNIPLNYVKKIYSKLLKLTQSHEVQDLTKKAGHTTRI
ncbi:MAG: YegP family protein [Bacteroidota bacterium]